MQDLQTAIFVLLIVVMVVITYVSMGGQLVHNFGPSPPGIGTRPNLQMIPATFPGWSSPGAAPPNAPSAVHGAVRNFASGQR